MIRYEDDCVSCETCIGCERGIKRPRIYCDHCGRPIGMDERVYDVDLYGHVCEDCIREILPHRTAEEVLEG